MLQTKLDDATTLLWNLLEKAQPDQVAVAWSGGKDSTLALFLWRTVLQEAGLDHQGLTALTLDTGCKFPEILHFRDTISKELNLRLLTAAPAFDTTNYPFAEDRERCCSELKITPLKQAVAKHGISHLITGIRRDEHPSRSDRISVEDRPGFDYVMVNPVLEFTEQDIWDANRQFGIPYCSLYEQGYRSIGCIPCTRRGAPDKDERAGRDQTKENLLNNLHNLGYF